MNVILRNVPHFVLASERFAKLPFAFFWKGACDQLTLPKSDNAPVLCDEGKLSSRMRRVLQPDSAITTDISFREGVFDS